MKTVEVAVLLILSAQWAAASDFDLPALKYDQRTTGSLARAPGPISGYHKVLSTGVKADLSASDAARVYTVKIEPLAVQSNNSAGRISGGLPASETLDLRESAADSRAAPDYSLISRDPVKQR